MNAVPPQGPGLLDVVSGEGGLPPEGRERRRWEVRLGGALADKQFELFYQPLVELRSGALTGFEALIRWRHPRRGLVSPTQFIPVVQDIGLIVPLGEWVIRRACEEAITWPAPMRLSVNLSEAQFAAAGLPETVAAILAETGFAATRLELEITDPAAPGEGSPVGATARALRRMGVRLVLDDCTLPAGAAGGFDRIKFECQGALELPQGELAAVLAECRARGVESSAKLVEHPSQRRALLAAGCGEAQGFLFGPPRPAWDLVDLLDDTGPCPALLMMQAAD